ncbi:hypothetical protein GCM10022225_37030 [Plantactinospora mayteni]
MTRAFGYLLKQVAARAGLDNETTRPASPTQRGDRLRSHRPPASLLPRLHGTGAAPGSGAAVNPAPARGDDSAAGD